MKDASPPAAADRVFTEGQRNAQRRYADPDRAARIVNGVADPFSLSPEQVAFLESLPFFFLATTDGKHNVQCNFKGGGPGILRVSDPRTLYYPEFPGNDMMLSVGNILTHPYVGLLALSFDPPKRLKINGKAELIEGEQCPYLPHWPEARVCVRVTVLHVLRNCARRIRPPHRES